METFKIIDKLYKYNTASEEELIFLLENLEQKSKEYLFEKAHQVSLKNYGNDVYIRGLIEFTNYCVRHCRYCGIRSENDNAERYRLTKQEIIDCAILGDKLGYKTYVLQGGEDPYYTDEVLIDIIKSIKKLFPDNAITLSVGERSYASYKALYDAGADRYLIRHETATRELYQKLHPKASFDNRRKCLQNLKEIGYQIGAGFMVGLPEETTRDLVNNLMYIKELNPEMCGIGPFIPHKDTPLKDENKGSTEMTLVMISLARLLVPTALLPATTALGSADPLGREKGLKAGANVVMPNLSPTDVREKYSLYNGKICTGDEAAECRGCIERRINTAGFNLKVCRGDNIEWKRNLEKQVKLINE